MTSVLTNSVIDRKRKEYHWYLLVFIIYNLQGVVYPSGIINQLAQVTMIVWAIIVGKHYIFSNPFTDPPLLKATKLLLLMYLVYGIINLGVEQPRFNGLNRPNSYVYLQAYLNSLLPIFMFIRYARYGILTKREFRILFYIFLVIGILLMIRTHAESLAKAAARHSDAEEFQNNAGYVFVAAMPLALAFRKKIVQFIFVFLMLAVTVYSMKRGAILTASVMALIFTVQSIIKAPKNTTKFGILILFLSVILIEAVYVSYQYETSPYFRERIELTQEGNDSGRGDLKEKIMSKSIDQLSLGTFFFGYGANSTIGFAGNYAHQDWFETWSNNGVIGLSLLAYFYYALFISIKRTRKRLSSDMSVMYQMLFLACFLPTFYSMSIQEMRISITMPLGILCYIQTKYYSKQQIKNTCQSK